MSARLRIHRNPLLRTWWIRCDWCYSSHQNLTWRDAMQMAEAHYGWHTKCGDVA